MSARTMLRPRWIQSSSSLQAECYVATRFECIFTQGLEVDSPQIQNKTKGQVHMVGHTERRYTGYMLICEDPGQEYQYFSFVR